MIKIKTEVTRENGQIELTIWEVDTTKDKQFFDGGGTFNLDKKLIENISFKEENLGRILNELEDLENIINEEKEEAEADYDGSLQQAHDDHQRTELNAIIKNQ